MRAGGIGRRRAGRSCLPFPGARDGPPDRSQAGFAARCRLLVAQ